MMRVNMVAAVVLVGFAAVGTAQGASRNDPKTMIDLWAQADEQCRGGSGNDQATLDACTEREAYAKRLGHLGWCLKSVRQGSTETAWKRCR
jgi:hypothetical protein